MKNRLDSEPSNGDAGSRQAAGRDHDAGGSTLNQRAAPRCDGTDDGNAYEGVGQSARAYRAGLEGEPDPRIFLAAERTALAWNRSALALMAFGFVVERAGFLGEALSANVPAGASWPAAVLGIVAMLMAASVAGLSAWRGRLILEALIRHAPPEAVPPRRVALLGWATMALGLWLSVWLTIETAMRVGSLKGLA